MHRLLLIALAPLVAGLALTGCDDKKGSDASRSHKAYLEKQKAKDPEEYRRERLKAFNRSVD